MTRLVFWSCEYCGSKPDGHEATCPGCGNPRHGKIESGPILRQTEMVSTWASACAVSGVANMYDPYSSTCRRW